MMGVKVKVVEEREWDGIGWDGSDNGVLKQAMSTTLV
jgi:hypothetical protein